MDVVATANGNANANANVTAASARITPMRLTKFELTQLIGMRMEQLARGAPPTVPVDDTVHDVREIAMRELDSHTMPLLVQRRLPCGRVERMHISECSW